MFMWPWPEEKNQIPEEECEKNKFSDFSAAEALIATEKARADLEYQMEPVYTAIKFAAKQGRTGCIIYGENKSWNYTKWRSTNHSKFDSSYTQQIVRKLKELGYYVKDEWTPEKSDDYKLTISWGDKDD